MAPRSGLEPETLCLEGRCSIQLSYRGKLTVAMMEELCSFSAGTVDAIEKSAQQMFDDMCQ